MVTLHGEHREFGAAMTITPVSESAAAVAVIVLTILGLVSVIPGIMVAVATIVVGAAILLQGAQTISEYSVLVTSDTAGSAAATTAPGGGVTLAFLAGGAGIVLGIIALFTHTPVLTPIALIVFGGALLLGGAAHARRALPAPSAVPGQPGPTAAQQIVAAQFAEVASGTQIIVGIAAIVLGILALIPIHDTILTLVGLLAVGGGVLVAAAASGGFVMSAFRH